VVKEVLQKLKKFFWFLPGFLLWAAYPPMGEKVDVLFALVPLMWLSRKGDVKKSAKCWFQSGMFFWVATLSWMPAIVKNGGPWPLVVLGWFGLAAYCSLYFAAYGYLSAAVWKWAREDVGGAETPRANYWRRLVAVFFAEPVLWCGLELVRSRFGGGFAWNQLGVVPANGGFASPAAIGGIYLLSAVVILINGMLAGVVERVWNASKSPFRNLRVYGSLETVITTVMVIMVYFLPGAFNGHDVERESLKVALIQRNFPCCFAKDRGNENPWQVYQRLLANPAYLKPDLVILPESAMSEFGPVDSQRAYSFADWVFDLTGASLLAGGSRREEKREYNSAALYCSANNTVNAQIYDKVHLVPFGEFIPGDKVITILQKLAPVGSCTPGELKTLTLPLDGREVEMGVAICFEDTDSAQLRRLAEMGAKVLVLITNDSWFSNSHEAVQHSWQAVARAVETGLPVVRVGNSGVSGVISPDGKATWLIDENGRELVDKEAAMCERVEIAKSAPRRTVYVQLGDKPFAVLFSLLLITMILVKYRNEYEKRRYLSM
jgi:apolipoprotein N-acyltransferase